MEYLLFHSIEAQARSAPEHVAYRCRKAQLTYAQLDRATNQLANVLIASCVKPGDRVGIYIDRSLESVVAVHGTLKAGAIYVPLDPEAPYPRTRHLIQNCDIEVVITNPGPARKLSRAVDQTVALRQVVGGEVEGIPSKGWQQVYEAADHAPGLTILGDDLAYIIHTSGSTGTPKGIMHTHRSGLAYAALTVELYGLDTDDIIGHHCALHYDMSTLGLFAAPLAGSTTVVVTDGHTKFPTSLIKLVEDEKISVWYSVPLALLQMLRSPTLNDHDLGALRWILYAGEVFAPNHLRDLMRHAPNARVSNVYGPAETNQCTYYNLDTPPEGDAPIPIGYAWGDTELLIVDQEDSPVAPNEVGELLVRSSTTMRGYWKRPDLTEGSFYIRERIEGITEKFYRTGDHVYTDGEGRLVFVGRKDRQVKIRGHRVELEEVEAAVVAIEGILEAAVFVRTLGDNEKQIEAMVVATEGVSLEAVKGSLAAKLPHYCMPAEIIATDELPRGDGGKIDRLRIAAMIHT